MTNIKTVHGEIFKETYNKKYSLSAINASTYLVIEDQVNAKQHDNLPHNAFTIANQDITSTLFVFLDGMIDQTKPDYIVFPTQNMTVNLDDGVSFTSLFILNTSVAHNIAADAVKMRVATIKRVA
jgi:hypothetical protein